MLTPVQESNLCGRDGKHSVGYCHAGALPKPIYDKTGFCMKQVAKAHGRCVVSCMQVTQLSLALSVSHASVAACQSHKFAQERA